MGRDDTLYLSCSRSSSFILSPNDTSRRVCLANLVRSMTDGRTDRQFHILYFIRYFLIFSFISIEIVQVSFLKQFLINYSVSFSKVERISALSNIEM